jgi:3-phenylpropionate/trans-cinnamate dioxygenase ferredoxin subunit
MPDYTRVGVLNDFAPGVMQPVDADGRSIVLLRLEDRFYAFDNFCTHEGVTLTSGYGVVAKNRVVCMLHSSAFDVATGEVLAGPAPDPLQTYEVLIQNEDVFVALPG